jgi:arginase
MTVHPTHTGRAVRILGVPMDLGADRRGVNMGPTALRIAGLAKKLEELDYAVADDGDVGVPGPENRNPGDPKAKFLREIYHVCNRLRIRAVRALAAGEMPIVIGGDHSMAIGTIAGISEFYRAREEEIGVIWVDAHADMNTPESSPSGNIHGMPLAVALGFGAPELTELGGFSPKVRREHVALIGLRNLDTIEKKIVNDSGVHAYTMRDLDEHGMRVVMADAIRKVTAGTAGFHLSFDLDSLDPTVAPGVATPVRGGIDWREAHLLMEMAADTGKMLGLEIAELNPVLDVKNQTGETAVELICSALGKSIL